MSEQCSDHFQTSRNQMPIILFYLVVRSKVRASERGLEVHQITLNAQHTFSDPKKWWLGRKTTVTLEPF
jgi:hypothetical protein